MLASALAPKPCLTQPFRPHVLPVTLFLLQPERYNPRKPRNCSPEAIFFWMLCRESVWRDSYLPVPRLQVGVACVTAPWGLKDTQTQVATKQTNSILSVSHALNFEMDADFLNFRDFCLLPKWQENDKKTSLLDLTTEMNFLRSSPIVVFRILKRKKKKVEASQKG